MKSENLGVWGYKIFPEIDLGKYQRIVWKLLKIGLKRL